MIEHINRYFGGPAMALLFLTYIIIMAFSAWLTWRIYTSSACYKSLVAPSWLPDGWALFFISAVAFGLSCIGIMLAYPMLTPTQKFNLYLFYIASGIAWLVWEAVGFMACGLSTSTFILVAMLMINMAMTYYLYHISLTAAVLQVPFVLYTIFLLAMTGDYSVINSVNKIPQPIVTP